MYRRNQEPPMPVEYKSESGEEDDEDSSEEESDSEPPPLPVPFPEEEESGSETESESDEPDSNVKPLALNLMEEAQKSSNVAKKSRSKPNAPVPTTPTKPVAAAAKRTVEDNSKPSNAKFNFVRLWTDEDEIVLLQGMMDYKFRRNSDPIADLDAFYESIKKKFHIYISRVQLQDKFKRLRKKFENNKRKVKESEERIFSKPHDQKVYDLSKMFWGNETGEENRVVKSPKANGSVANKKVNETLSEEEAKIVKKVNGTESEEVKNVKKVNGTESEEVKNVKNAVVVSGERRKPKKLNFSSGGASMEETMLKTGREFYEAGLGIEGENEWDKLRVEEIKLRREEMKLYLKQLEVRAAQTKLVLGVMNCEDD